VKHSPLFRQSSAPELARPAFSLASRDWTIPLGVGSFDPVHRTLNSESVRVRLSPRESDVLFHVASRESPTPIEQVAEQVWGCATAADTTACRQVLRTLRRKLDTFDGGIQLVNVSGHGYFLTTRERPLIGLQFNKD
jgi:DNA-binding response OmpR family regulator